MYLLLFFCLSFFGSTSAAFSLGGDPYVLGSNNLRHQFSAEARIRWNEEVQALEGEHSRGSGFDPGSNIYVEHCGSVAELWTLIEKKLLLYLRRGVRLVVIDSIAALFRVEFDHEMGVARAAELKRLGRRLKHLSHQWQAAIVCVNQVIEWPLLFCNQSCLHSHRACRFSHQLLQPFTPQSRCYMRV
eukprot:m.559263 g.559263  ORF g.559263 m.559263 type:complete len:187 (+) comp22204_c0_seq6:777-1337(+)